MTKVPLVSIIIPAFNPQFFAVALQSALGQTYENLEVLVCDDSQGDEIEGLVRSAANQASVNLRYVRNLQRLGFQKNLLYGLECAEGEYVKILCDDDQLFLQCIEQQARVLRAHSDVSLVLAQRLFADASDFILPTRLENVRFAMVDSLFKGSDVLSILDGRKINFLGNFSAALMRRSDILHWVRALTQQGQGFVALIDLALFACLLRRGNMVMLSGVAGIERLHSDRLSKQGQVLSAAKAEWNWLMEMLKARTGESAPAHGWCRYVELEKVADSQRQWQEMCLLRILGNWSTRLQGRVGSDCESYAQFYQQWLACRRFSDVQKDLMPQTVAAWPSKPRIVPVILDCDGNSDAVRLTLNSLSIQLYAPMVTLLLSGAQFDVSGKVVRLPIWNDWSAQLNSVLGSLEGADWFYMLRAGDQLSESALLVLAERIAVLPGLACIYSDEGALHDGVSCEPVFKPDFNLDLFRAYPYVGRALAFDLQIFKNMGGFESLCGELAPHDLLWRLVESLGPQVVEHIAEIQLESSFSFAQWLSLEQVVEQSPLILSRHLQRLGVEHSIRHDDLSLLNRVDYQHDERPLVSIILTASDDLSALQNCIEELVKHTAYTHYELLVVGGPVTNSDVREWLNGMAEIGSSMLRVLQGAVSCNVATIVNYAARQARGEYLLLLASDTRIYEADWLSELLNHALRPEVGVVGGKVLDLQGKVLQAGMVLGVGSVAGAAFVGEKSSARGYQQRLQVAQNWSAVSSDCLMVRKALFDSLGGLDEANFTEGLQDLDFCLRAGGEGYLVVWTPYAQLIRANSLSSEKALPHERLKRRLEEQQQFCERWLPKVIRDPAYNTCLNLVRADFALEPSLRGSWSPLCSRSKPSILGLPINSSAIGHYRVSQPFYELEAAGRVVGQISYELPSVVRLARMDPDVVILQLRHSSDSSADIQRIARFSNARRIFEMDDYVLSAPKKNTHTRNKPADIEQHLRHSISLCDRVVVTTQALADAVSDMHRDIRVVPNMLAPQLWLGLQSRRAVSVKPRVGWGGGTSHSGDLEIIVDVVRELANEVEWVFFGMCPEELRPYIHEFHPAVALDLYPAKLASLNLDLALAPLEFHIFNDCKSNLRLLEYGACGYPVICTDTEAYRGYLPCTRVHSNSTQEWLQAIRMHLSDPAASYRMGDELREAVLRDFVLRADNLQHWVWGWLAD